jgi:two-component system LytT family response regulator
MKDTKMRVLIVDDEPLARERVRTMLAGHEDVEIVGEAGDGKSAIEQVEALAPDLMFLDVQMPELDGLQVLEALPQDKWPQVIFCTAYSEYAVQAFEVQAVDYLLKPFDRKRLEAALDKVRARFAESKSSSGRQEELEEKLEGLLQRLDDNGSQPTRLLVKSAGRIVFVPLEEIDYFEAASNYVKVNVAGKTHLRRETMSNLEKLLEGYRFQRIHRSTIVNLERIRELQPLFHGEYAVILQDGTELTMSRGYREKLQERLGISF